MKMPSQRPARSFRNQLTTTSPIFAIVCLMTACLATTLLQAQGVAPVNQNVSQIAILRWYPVNRIPAVISLSAYGDGAPEMLAFDGSHMVVSTSSSAAFGCRTAGEFSQNPSEGVSGGEELCPINLYPGTPASWLAYDGVRVWFSNSANNTP